MNPVHFGWMIFWLCWLGMMIVWGIGYWKLLPSYYERRKLDNLKRWGGLYRNEPERLREDSQREALWCCVGWMFVEPGRLFMRITGNHMTASERQEMKVLEAREVIRQYEAEEKAKFDAELTKGNLKSRTSATFAKARRARFGADWFGR